MLVVVFLCCSGGCIHVAVVAAHGGFAAVTHTTEDPSKNIPCDSLYLVAH